MTKTYDNEQTLMSKTRALLKGEAVSLIDIATKTGISYFWLKKFAAGEFKNPSVNRVQYLYEFLTGQKIL